MARKKRNLATFDDFANSNINNNDSVNTDVNENTDTNEIVNIKGNDNKNNNINDNVNINDNNETENQGDYLDKLIEGNAKKKNNETVLTGIYLQKDISQILDRLAKKGGRGAKSRIVNEALRAVFTEKGLL